MTINTEKIDDLLRVSLQSGRANAINWDFIRESDLLLDEIEKHPPRAMVITGHRRSFSAGLDLIEIYNFDEAEITAFVAAFDEMFLRWFALPTAVIAHVNGHAIAGGCILAMAADYRVMSGGQIGINEVRLGIPFPSGAFEVARHALRQDAWAPCFLEGRRLSKEDALKFGLVHEIAEEHDGEGVALAAARRFAASPQSAIATIKHDLRQEALVRARQDAAASQDRFIRAWFSRDARAEVGRLRERLLGKM